MSTRTNNKPNKLLFSWTFLFKVSQKIKSNRPDIIVKNNKRKKKCLLTDMSLPTNNHISVQKYTYKHLEGEIVKIVASQNYIHVSKSLTHGYYKERVK